MKIHFIHFCHFLSSITDVHLESSGSGSGRETKSSLSVESGGSSRGGGGLTWTPPTGSVEGSTPTWTEGTPSFTESSSSGDMGIIYLYFDMDNSNFLYFYSTQIDVSNKLSPGCPTTPIRSGMRGDVATVEEALASLTSEMVSYRFN